MIAEIRRNSERPLTLPESKNLGVGADKPERRNPSAKSERILAAASKLFAANGYEGTSMEKIAASAKVNKQLLFYYFKNKDGIFLEVVEHAFLNFLGDQESLHRKMRALDPLDAIRAMADHLFRSDDEYIHMQRVLADANLRGGVGLEHLESVTSAYSGLMDALRDLLRRGHDAGTFRAGLDAEEVYLSMMGACSYRVVNAASISQFLAIDVVSQEGKRRSRDKAIELAIFGLRGLG